MTEVSDAIAESAAGPKKMEADGVVVEQHNLKDQIAADRYARGNAAVASGTGLKLTQIKFPGIR